MNPIADRKEQGSGVAGYQTDLEIQLGCLKNNNLGVEGRTCPRFWDAIDENLCVTDMKSHGGYFERLGCSFESGLLMYVPIYLGEQFRHIVPLPERKLRSVFYCESRQTTTERPLEASSSLKEAMCQRGT